MNNYYQEPDLAAECAEHEHEKQIASMEFESSVDCESALTTIELIKNPEAWVSDHVADPNEELALVYKAIAIFENDQHELATAVRNILKNKIRIVAEYVANKSCGC